VAEYVHYALTDPEPLGIWAGAPRLEHRAVPRPEFFSPQGLDAKQ
jgi:hypothetical protein